MIDILIAQAQAQGTNGMFVGWLGGGATVAGIASYIIHRQVKKIVNHVDNSNIHIRPGAVLVTDKDCEAAQKNFATIVEGIKEDAKENRESVKAVHERLEKLIDITFEHKTAIIEAIAKIKG